MGKGHHGNGDGQLQTGDKILAVSGDTMGMGTPWGRGHHRGIIMGTSWGQGQAWGHHGDGDIMGTGMGTPWGHCGDDDRDGQLRIGDKILAVSGDTGMGTSWGWGQEWGHHGDGDIRGWGHQGAGDTTGTRIRWGHVGDKDGDTTVPRCRP